MAARPPRRRVSVFAVLIGAVLVLLALAGIYVGAAQPLQLWPYGRG